MAQHGKRRALGQHFLRDHGVIQKIAETAVAGSIERGCTSLLEIGPGQGAITQPLLQLLSEQRQISEFIICERDRELAANWTTQALIHQAGQESKPTFGQVQVHEGDFVILPESAWLRPRMGVVSNLPYSAGTAILDRLARHPGQIPIMVLMFQAEVAKRLRAEPDTREWGSLSVWLQNRWDVKKLINVAPGAFKPPPEVNSEVVTLIPREQPRVPVPQTPEAEKRWEAMLKAAFAQRRKMLRSGFGSQLHYRNALESAGVDGTKRAETLSWDEWTRLYQALS